MDEVCNSNTVSVEDLGIIAKDLLSTATKILIWIHIITPRTCARGKAISFVVVVIVVVIHTDTDF